MQNPFLNVEISFSKIPKLDLESEKLNMQSVKNANIESNFTILDCDIGIF